MRIYQCKSELPFSREELDALQNNFDYPKSSQLAKMDTHFAFGSIESMNWLSLVEYSRKYKVSVSTLRRRIKSKKIEFKLDDGKYFLQDETPTKKGSIAPLAQKAVKEAKSSELLEENNPMDELLPQKNRVDISTGGSSGLEGLTQTVNSMFVELKRAYSFILQEREEQILQLKSEISDLKTLVRVLEDESLKNNGLMSK